MLDVSDALIQKASVSHPIANRMPGSGSHVDVGFRCEIKGEWNAQIGFVEIRNVVHKRAFISSVDESQAWRAPERHDNGVNYTIQGRIDCRKCLIYGIGVIEVGDFA